MDGRTTRESRTDVLLEVWSEAGVDWMHPHPLAEPHFEAVRHLPLVSRPRLGLLISDLCRLVTGLRGPSDRELAAGVTPDDCRRSMGLLVAEASLRRMRWAPFRGSEIGYHSTLGMRRMALAQQGPQPGAEDGRRHRLDRGGDEEEDEDEDEEEDEDGFEFVPWQLVLSPTRQRQLWSAAAEPSPTGYDGDRPGYDPRDLAETSMAADLDVSFDLVVPQARQADTGDQAAGLFGRRLLRPDVGGIGRV